MHKKKQFRLHQKIFIPIVVLFTVIFLNINSGLQTTKSLSASRDITLPALENRYENPLKVSSFTELIGNFLAQLQTIIGWLAIIMIVIGGIVYITATGRSGQIELGKKILTFALLGFVVVVAAPSILKEIVDLASGGNGMTNSDVVNNAKPIKSIIESILAFVITLVGLVATIGFVISGFLFIGAGGDSGKAEKARKALIYSIIGVALAGGALILVKQIFLLMGANI